jgi:hypothetical protein
VERQEAGGAARGSAGAGCRSSGADGGRGAVSVFRLRRGLGRGLATATTMVSSPSPSPSPATVSPTRMLRDRDGSLISEISYRITEPDQDREEAQRHDGNDQSVFGESRSRLAGPKPPDELSHGAVQVPDHPGSGCGNAMDIIGGAGSMPGGLSREPISQSLGGQRLSDGDEGRVACAGQTTGWRGARSRTFCGRNGYPRVLGEFSPSLPRAASAR